MGSSEKEGIKRNSNTFNSALLPKTLRVGYLNVGVDLYIPNALQCFTCFKYGHHDCRCKKSSSESLCRHCGEVANTHNSSNCNNKIKCANCGGDMWLFPEHVRSRNEKRKLSPLSIEKDSDKFYLKISL